MSEFVMEEQIFHNWCWAAVGQSVNNYFKPDKPMDQYGVAALVLGLAPGSCSGAGAPGCNKGQSLTTVLSKLQRLGGTPILGALTFPAIKQTIDGGWPIPVRIVWDDDPGNAHAVVISGYSLSASGAPLLQVEDPFFGRSIVDYDVFVSGYHVSGHWERTYKLV
ncbi:MAG TPA: papain-like cysteine protease family protein [Bryobacteraceae bacterium]|jgi:hypothetical protein|nr:papain-like cysteine protease family protein [Bryobacteraceae bacterium]